MSAEETEPLLAAAVVRVTGERRDEDPSGGGGGGGAGFFVTPELILTCAHVVSDALDLPPEATVEPGARVTVRLLLANNGDGVAAGPTAPAEVVDWVPLGEDRTGDVALLRVSRPLPGARPLPMADAKSLRDHRSWVVGFTQAHPHGLWHRGRLLGITGGGWIQLARMDGEGAHVEGGFSGSPVWDEELDAVVGMMVAAEPVRAAQQAFALHTGVIVENLRELEAVADPPSPFRGLAPFEEKDSEVFFGRAAEIGKAVDAVRGHPVVTVYGPSGCGKSSLVLAGVVPKVRRDAYDVLVLGAGHAGSLRVALATELYEAARAGDDGPPRATDVDQVDRWLAELGLVDAYHRATGRPARRLLLVLDQAEALLNRPEQEIAETIALIFPQRPPTGLRVLVTLRADFMDAALRHPHLGPALQSGETLPLTPMTPDQLRDVITEPLRRIPAVAYDPGLDQRIVDDAGGEPGVLPLLGFVLQELWDKRSGGRLRTQTYHDIGRVTGALSRHAESVWKECVTSGTQDDAGRLLTGLVKVLPGGGAPLRRALTRQEAGEDRWRLAQALAERRLLVLYGGDGRPESAELAHEALITAWPTLADVTRADAAFLTARAELRHDLERARQEDGPGPAVLPMGAEHLTGREAELAAAEREFLASVRRRVRARRRLRGTALVAAALALTLIASLLTYLVQQSQVSTERQAEGRSRALAVRSDELTDSDPGAAALAAVAAYEVAPTQEARSALMRRYQEQRRTAWLLSGAEGALNAAAMSSDGRVTLVTSETGRATLFVRGADGRVRTRQLNLAENVLVPAVSRDGRRIAYVRDGDGVVVWRDVTPGAKELVGRAHELEGAFSHISLAASSGMDDFKILDFSPDARRLVATPAGDSGLPAQVWDLATGQPHSLPRRIPRLSEVWFGPDEDTLIATVMGEGPTGSLLTIDLASGTVRVRAGKVELNGTSVSGDGRVAVVCRKAGSSSDIAARYQAIRISDGAVLRSVREESFCNDTAVDRTGAHVAVSGASGQGDVWDVFGTAGTAKPVSFLGPSPVGANSELPLLGAPDSPVVPTKEDNAIRGWALRRSDGAVAYSPPKLLGDGSTMVVRVGRDSGRLRVVETEGDGKVIADVRTDAKTPPDAKQPLAVNSAGTLVADASDLNRITVRALPSLRKVSEFETARPALSEEGASLDFLFLKGNEVATLAGTVVESWDGLSGRRLAPPIDLRNLHLTRRRNPSYLVGPDTDPGYLTVTVQGDPYVHAVELRTGKENPRRRLRLGGGLVTAVPMKDTRFMGVFSVGSMVELWAVRPPGAAHRVIGPLGPVTQNRWAVSYIGASRFLFADKNSIRVFDAADPDYQQTYVFGTRQGFLSAAKDGTAVLMAPPDNGPMSLLRLDPALWKRRLCATIGRDLSESERDGLPPGLPAHVCPA
ncbi:trypsin-like peptidase domain-containing protein [Streptomyces sp. NPDC014940]|uniref:nSTAND1 domain-containing NTPase n=1 Tax=Streptomyces sp. NPDC014940 TaxID=3364932 RepID=UPI0036FAEA2B